MPSLFFARVLPVNMDAALKKQWKSKETRGALLAAVVNTRNDALREFGLITETWKHKPTFTSKIRYAGGSAIVEITTNDKVFHYLNVGTLKRFVPMKRNPKFIPKTRPGFSASWPGQGGPVLGKDGKPFILKGYKSTQSVTLRGKPKKIKVPKSLPGIQARMFTKTVKTILDATFAKRVDQAVFRR